MRHVSMMLWLAVLVLAAACASPATPVPTATPHLDFSGDNAYSKYLADQMKLGPHPVGTAADRSTGDYIIGELKANHWNVSTQEFNFHGYAIRNVIAKAAEGKGPVLLLGAHYDTRRYADQDKVNPSAPMPGANDGASGVAVLLELSRTLDLSRLDNEVWLVFFDAEDDGEINMCQAPGSGSSKWVVPPDCDPGPWPWSVGATFVAEHLDTKPALVLVVDMIGDKDLNIYYEHNSDAQVQQDIWAVAARLGYSEQFIPQYKWSMEDDHTPFLQRGITAVDLIDFDYPYWHTTEDTADKVSGASLGKVGLVLQTWLEEKNH